MYGECLRLGLPGEQGLTAGQSDGAVPLQGIATNNLQRWPKISGSLAKNLFGNRIWLQECTDA